MTTTLPDSGGSKKLRNAVVNNVVFRLLSQVIVALTYVLLVRLLSEQDFGLYQLFYAVPPVIASVFSLGIAVTLSRYSPEYFASKNFGYADTLFSWATRLRFATSIFILGTIVLFWDTIAPFFKIEQYQNLFLILSAVTVTLFQCRLLVISLSSYLLQQWSMGLTAAFSFIKIMAYAGIALFDFTLQSILIADLIAYLIYYASLAWAHRRFIPHPADKETLPKHERRRVFRFGIMNNFNDIGTLTLNSRTDNLFIAAIMSPAFVGAYAFCTQLEQMIQKMLPTRFFRSVIHAVIFKLNYKSESARATQYFTFLLKLNYLSMFPVFVLIAAVPEAIINIVFGGKFIEFSNTLVAVFAFSLLSNFQQPVSMIAQLGERAGIILLSKIFAVYNIVANIILIPLYGIMGAVVATGSAIFLKNAFIWFFVRDVASLKGSGRFFLQQLVFWTACLIALRYLGQELSDFMTLLVTLPAMAVAAIVSLRLADFTPEEITILNQLGTSKMQGLLQRLGIIGRAR